MIERSPGRGDPTSYVIEIEHAIKEFGSVRALDDVSISIRENEFFALLGPSGCGKTTLLRCLGGFEQVSSGRLLLDGRDMVGSKPYERPVNMMFQSYALFPHMRVWDNVAYGLRAERRPAQEIRDRVDDVLGKVGLLHLSERRPNQLSGGERQRVALARAIVKRPRVLLLDEPLAALDRKLRGEMQIELKRLQHEVGITFIVVTHDQEEALTMADRVAVMRAGRVLQVDTPVELYDHPANHFVASFIGKMNFLRGVVAPGGLQVDLHGLVRSRPSDLADGSDAYLAIRPEAARLLGAGVAPTPADVTLPAIIEAVAFVGSQVQTHIRLDGVATTFVVTSDKRDVSALVGARVLVAWLMDDAQVLAA